MSTTITGKLNDPAKEFPNTAGVNFLIRIGVKERDFKTKEDIWANYSAFVFAKEGPQAEFYRQKLVAGTVVEVTCSGLIPEVYGDKQLVTLKMQQPSIKYVFSGTPYQNAPAPAPQAAPTQQPQQQQPPVAPGADEFDDIPF